MKKDKSQVSDDHGLTLNIPADILNSLFRTNINPPVVGPPFELDSWATQKLCNIIKGYDRSYPFLGVEGDQDELYGRARNQVDAIQCFAMAHRSIWKGSKHFLSRIDPALIMSWAKEANSLFKHQGKVSAKFLKQLCAKFQLDYDPKVFQTHNPDFALMYFFNHAVVFLGSGKEIHGLATAVRINEAGELCFYGHFPTGPNQGADLPYEHREHISVYTCVTRHIRPQPIPVHEVPPENTRRWAIPMYLHPAPDIGLVPEYTKEYSGVPYKEMIASAFPQRKEEE